MSGMNWMKAGVILAAFLISSLWVLEMSADARVGGGRSSGSRGSRSYSSPSPSRSYSSPTQTQRPSAVQPSAPMQQQRPPSMWRSFAYGALGGLVGSMLFSGLGHGFGGGMGGFGGSGFGFIEILIIGLLLYGVYRFFKKKKEAETVPGTYYQSGANQASYAPAYQEQGSGGGDVDAGLGYIRQMDPSFDEGRFNELCTDNFFRIQGAWANRDMGSVRNILTDEMLGLLQGEAEKLKAAKKINKLDNIAVRTVEITEAWQEGGKDFITVKFLANLVDYTVSESGDLLEGSRTEPVKFEEYWTFTRPVGNNTWQLSAINQP